MIPLSNWPLTREIIHIATSALLLVFGATWFYSPGFPAGHEYCTAWLIDGYLLLLLFLVALAKKGSGKGNGPYVWLPEKVTCLFIVGLLLVATVFVFANFYLYSNGVVHTIRNVPDAKQQVTALSGTTNTSVVLQQPALQISVTNADVVPHLPSSSPVTTTTPAPSDYDSLSTRDDAIYFSAVTLTTVGYGDFAAEKYPARWYVLWELGTGLLLIGGILAILIGRLTGFDSERTGCLLATNGPKGPICPFAVKQPSSDGVAHP